MPRAKSKEPTSDSTDAKTRILTAALELFAERGFEATKTAEIARRARVAEKTLFACFQSKDALFENVLTPSMLALLIPGADEPLELYGKDRRLLSDFITAIMKNRFGVYARQPREFKLVVQELLLRPALAQRFVDGIAQQAMGTIEKTLRTLQRKGELRSIPFARVHRTCISVLVGYSICRLILWPNRKWDDDAELDESIAILVDGLRPRSPARVLPARQKRSKPKRVSPGRTARPAAKTRAR